MWAKKMQIGAHYSFAGGQELIRQRHSQELQEVIKAIASIDAEAYRVKESREKTMLGRLLYAPKLINSHMLEGFLYQQPYQWNTPERRLRVTFEH